MNPGTEFGTEKRLCHFAKDLILMIEYCFEKDFYSFFVFIVS